jgi:hypothetical protein
MGKSHTLNGWLSSDVKRITMMAGHTHGHFANAPAVQPWNFFGETPVYSRNARLK